METRDVSVIIPIHNGKDWIDKCFTSILKQTAVHKIQLEVSVCNDSSSDNTKDLLEKWKVLFEENDINFVLYENESKLPKGVGYSKNRAVSISQGRYLCFQDVDDVMLPERILKQYNFAKKLSDAVLIGSKFIRDPQDSTVRYTKWANSLTQEQLNIQIYTSHGPTIIMPTWFCHRNVYNSPETYRLSLFIRIGGFSEEGRGTPEDLIFFYKHLELNGTVARVDELLLIYKYHPSATTFSINELTIWNLRIKQLEQKVLAKWGSFTIWNAGKQGRKFYKSINSKYQQKVICLCDVDEKKIGNHYIPFNEETRTTDRPIPIVHFTKASKPMVICVKQDMTNGQFEENLKSLNLTEGEDYIFFC